MVMLCNVEDGSCHPYWPEKEEESAKYGKISVTLQAETAYDDFYTRKFLIQDEKVVILFPAYVFILITLNFPIG